ncbi:MAG: hypothetical protein ACTSYF_08255 [Promethearchaeota archaeon]
MTNQSREKEITLGDLFKEGLRRALKIHIPFILYLIYLLFGIIMLGLSIIKSTLDFNWQGFLVLILLIVIPGLLVGFLAWLGAKYKYY